jgi:hypothetical protein
VKLLALLVATAAIGAAQDPLDLARLKNFRAYRSFSNNPDPV